MTPALISLFSFSSLYGKVLVIVLSIFMVIGAIATVLDTFYKGDVSLGITLISIFVPLVLLLMYFFGVYTVFGYLFVAVFAWGAVKDSIDHPLF